MALSFTAALLAALFPLTSPAQQTAAKAASRKDAEWPNHHRDLAGSRYSPLAQIDRSNVARLATAWSWKPDTSEQPAEFRNQSTPLMVNGLLYFTSGINRSVYAVDAGTGAARWSWSMSEGARARRAPRRGAGRGVSYWTDGKERRIFVVTPGFQMVSLDANTGKQVPTFGTGGVVDLKLQLGVELNVDSAAIGNSSPPLVFEDIVVVGPALEVGLQPTSMRNVPGRIIALDARTGALRWRFNTIPQAGEPGNETWENESWRYTGNAGAWAPLSLDSKRGFLYLPVEAATGDYYGGHRHGDNLFSTSIVCLNVRTGKRVWYFQTVHHDIWDYDNPTAPFLTDIRVNGRRREALVQITKQSFAYVLDRVTGKPIWPIVERPVVASDVPGERASRTQPIPSRPTPFDRQGVTPNDLIDFTPALRAEALAALAPFRMGALFQPASLNNAADGTKGTISLPGTVGGANWEHGAYDPERGTLFVGSFTNPVILAMANDPKRSDMNYIMVGDEVPTVRGLPVIKPPYSRVTAIDLNSGNHRWMVPNGDTPDAVKQHPALAGLSIPPTGGFARPVMVATKTLLFVAEGWRGAPKLRALDKRTGATLAEFTLPGMASASPMTYAFNGVQYVAIWVGDTRANPPTQLVVMALK